MAQDWQKLTKMTGPQEIVIERVKIRDSGVKIEGEFELPPHGAAHHGRPGFCRHLY